MQEAETCIQVDINSDHEYYKSKGIPIAPQKNTGIFELQFLVSNKWYKLSNRLLLLLTSL